MFFKSIVLHYNLQGALHRRAWEHRQVLGRRQGQVRRQGQEPEGLGQRTETWRGQRR